MVTLQAHPEHALLISPLLELVGANPQKVAMKSTPAKRKPPAPMRLLGRR
ncbi:MAG: hypothetical protein RL350_1223, partial [Pseudomonadota bacterium]